MEPVCSLRNAVKGYGAGPVLGPVSLDIFPGELVGLRGANGAGKSTLLKLLAGLLQPEEGTLLRSKDLGPVSYLPQDVALYDTMTVQDNLKFWGTVYGLPAGAVKARTRWLLERLELTEKANAPARTCSGGMLRRLHLASALMVTPALLLLDEPTVGADPRSARLMLDLVEHFRAQGCAVVLVSHRQGELEEQATRLLTLDRGLLVGGQSS